MKKLLALVLALVMTMSLVTISNAAFKDADKIDYKEAVDVMNAVGVFIGDEKGNFNAKENLTREQAAKIIAYLELGSKAADALVGGATFTDVASTRWSAGFVGYCAQAGVVAGVGDSKFDPAGQLTALQFGKMLLVELGYDAKAAGMVGADWAINTSKLMAKAKLMDKIDGSVNQVLTREKAAQMTLNALKAPTVEYSTKGSSIIVNGAEINLGASEPTYVTNTVAKEQTISKQQLTNNGGYTIELGEKLYKDLRLDRTTDDFARPANQWFNKTTKIGTYTDTPDLTYTATVKNGEIYADLGLGKKVTADAVAIYTDGVKAGYTTNLVKGGDVKLADSGNGVLTEVFYNADNNTAIITHINTYYGEVAKTVAASASKDKHIVIDPDGGTMKPTLKSGESFNRDFETEVKFEDDAIVGYTYSVSANEIKSVKVAETAEGVVTEARNAKDEYYDAASIAFDGTVYKAAKKFIDNSEVGSNMLKGTYKVYLDQYGYMLSVEEVSELSGNYALLTQAAPHSAWVGDKAELIFADGTKKIVSTDKDYQKDGDDHIGNNTIVTYREDNNVYTLRAVVDSDKNDATQKTYQDAHTDKTETFTLTTDRAYFNVKKADGHTVNVPTNSATKFVVIDEEGAISTFTGIKNAPTIKATSADKVQAYWYCKNNGMTTIMFVFAANKITTGSMNKTIFFAEGSASDLISNKIGTYYEYQAVVNGEITTVKVDYAKGKDLKGLYKWYNVDSKGVITGLPTGTNNGFGDAYDAQDKTDGYMDAGQGIAKTSQDYTVILDTLTVSGGYTGKKLAVTVAEKAQIFYVDKNGKISESSYKALAQDDDDLIYALVEHNLVTKLFVVEKTDVVGNPDAFKIDAANYTVDYDDPSDVKVLAYTGADCSVLAGLNQVKAALAAAGYTKFNVKVAAGVYTITATIADGTTDFVWDSSTDYNKTGIKVKVDGKDYLVANSAKISGTTGIFGDVLKSADVKGTYAKATKANGDADGYVSVSTASALKDGYKYETGYYSVAAPTMTAFTTGSYSNTNFEVSADKTYAKDGEVVTITIGLKAGATADANDTFEFTIAATDAKDVKNPAKVTGIGATAVSNFAVGTLTVDAKNVGSITVACTATVIA